MSDTAIAIEHVSKRYILGERSTASTVRETFGNLVSRLRGRPPHPQTELWALKDVSAEIKRGELVGILGRNGAGKSTLLKILSRITSPTEGEIRIRGKVRSLLEVGTGFHPELTGRENIYLNGAILGMRKREIDRQFDEIVAFSEVERFLETPVKHYSSGMYVRLAFSVAAHLQPDILIVDEVLAVGDYSFQRKCMGKMKDVAAGGDRTVVFVSHNMGSMAQLCERGILMEKGEVKAIGPIQDVITTYLRSGVSHEAASVHFETDPVKACQYKSVEIVDNHGHVVSEFSCDEPVTIRVAFDLRKPVAGLQLTMALYNLEGIRILFSDVQDTEPAIMEQIGRGTHRFEVRVPPRLLAPGSYLVSLGCNSGYEGPIDNRPMCCEFTLTEMNSSRSARPGLLGVLLPWNHRRTT